LASLRDAPKERSPKTATASRMKRALQYLNCCLPMVAATRWQLRLRPLLVSSRWCHDVTAVCREVGMQPTSISTEALGATAAAADRAISSGTGRLDSWQARRLLATCGHAWLILNICES